MAFASIMDIISGFRNWKSARITTTAFTLTTVIMESM